MEIPESDKSVIGKRRQWGRVRSYNEPITTRVTGDAGWAYNAAKAEFVLNHATASRGDPDIGRPKLVFVCERD